MIKVLYVVSTLKRSGPVTQLLNILKSYNYRKFKPYILTLSPETEDSLWDEFNKNDLELFSLAKSRIESMFRGETMIREKVEQVAPEIIHSQGLRADMMVSDYSNEIPIISTVRNFPQLDYKMTYGVFAGSIMTKKHINALKMFNYCVCVSEGVRENLRVEFGLDNTLTIHNGVDLNIFSPIEKKKKIILRKKIGFSEESKLWISVGHLSVRKDPLFLIDAWKMSLGREVDNHLLFIGEGELSKICRDACDKINNMHIIGRVPNVVDYLQASDYYVSTSKAEGLPNTVLEAMACGLPVVLSSIKPHREILERNNESGIIYELGSLSGLVEALKQVASGDYDNLRSNALSVIQEHFSAKDMSYLYQTLYKRII